MSVSTSTPTPPPADESVDGRRAIPPLKDGDRLTRDEFMRRYEAMPGLKKAELIEGVVYVPSPVRLDYHGEPHLSLACWIGLYRAMTPGIRAGDNTTVHLDACNTPQPDCLLFIPADRGGQVKVDEGYVLGAPDLVAEVAASSTSYDLHDKLQAYQRNGVREYIVWRVLERRIDWFVLRGESYERLAPAPDGTLRSTVFPGLWLDASALLRGDLNAVVATVQQGLKSTEHADFAAQLQRAGSNPAS